MLKTLYLSKKALTIKAFHDIIVSETVLQTPHQTKDPSMSQHKIRTPVLALITVVALYVIFFITDHAVDREDLTFAQLIPRIVLNIIGGVALVILCGRIYDRLNKKPPSE